MLSNFWNLRVNERLTCWKNFRYELGLLPLGEAVTKLNNLWSTAPYVTYYLAPDQPNTWPDPWTLITENYYCDLAKALGSMYTIYFTSHKNVNLEIHIYHDCETNERSNVLYIDNGNYIINYWPFEIVNTIHIAEKKLKLLYRYTSNDLALEKY